MNHLQPTPDSTPVITTTEPVTAGSRFDGIAGDGEGTAASRQDSASTAGEGSTAHVLSPTLSRRQPEPVPTTPHHRSLDPRQQSGQAPSQPDPAAKPKSPVQSPAAKTVDDKSSPSKKKNPPPPRALTAARPSSRNTPPPADTFLPPLPKNPAPVVQNPPPPPATVFSPT